MEEHQLSPTKSPILLLHPLLTPHRCQGVQQTFWVVFVLDDKQPLIVLSVKGGLPVWLMRIAFVEIRTATGSELLKSGAKNIGDLFLGFDVGGKVEVIVWAASFTVSTGVLEGIRGERCSQSKHANVNGRLQQRVDRVGIRL